MRDRRLWQRLQRFRFDDGTGTPSFSARLGEAEGWNAGYTARVIEEYRRFLYLSVVLPGVAVPGLAVERAWAMHTEYERRYWDDLCGQTLGTALNFIPRDETVPTMTPRHAETIAAYTSEFGAPPPADIWAGVDVAYDPTTPSGFPGQVALTFAIVFVGTGALLLTTDEPELGAAFLILSAFGLGMGLWEWFFRAKRRRIRAFPGLKGDFTDFPIPDDVSGGQ